MCDNLATVATHMVLRCIEWEHRVHHACHSWGNKFLTYNDDIQGTASIIVAAVLGGIKHLDELLHPGRSWEQVSMWHSFEHTHAYASRWWLFQIIISTSAYLYTKYHKIIYIIESTQSPQSQRSMHVHPPDIRHFMMIWGFRSLSVPPFWRSCRC